MLEEYSVVIPADIEREDKIVFGLTARQLAILTPAAAGVWLAYLASGRLLPLPVFAVFAVPVLAAAAALALGSRDGLGLDRLLLAAWRQWRAPARLVIAPEGVADLPPGAAVSTKTNTKTKATVGWRPAPLRLPARAVGGDGVVDLGPDGVAVLVACSTVSFTLRTPAEQAALVAAFGRWLNAAGGPTQILVTAQQINLTPRITALREAAGGLPHPALEQACRDHTGYLAELADSRQLLTRRVLVIVREQTAGPGARPDSTRPDSAAAVRARRRAEVAVRSLAAAGINAEVLDNGRAAAVLAAAADPTAPPRDLHPSATTGEPITATTNRTNRTNRMKGLR